MQLLVDWVKKITDAELPVADKAPADRPVIYVGKAAVRAGLKLDDIASPSKEGVRIVVEGNRVLIGGQSDAATVKAVARFLEELGCRYFMDGPHRRGLPALQRISPSGHGHHREAGLLYRNPKGPSWEAVTGGRRGTGPAARTFGHAPLVGPVHPEGPLRRAPGILRHGGRRPAKNGDWLCTSNPAVTRSLRGQGDRRDQGRHARTRRSRRRTAAGYCQCDRCKAQDDPKSIEPSSGTVAVSTRYADFFDDVAKRVAKVCPDSVLSFYVTPTTRSRRTLNRKLSPNLCAVIAPIRYCRLHGDRRPDCPSAHAATRNDRRLGQGRARGSAITTTCTTSPTPRCRCSSSRPARRSSPTSRTRASRS